MQKSTFFLIILLFALMGCSSHKKKFIDVNSKSSSLPPLEKTLGVQEDKVEKEKVVVEVKTEKKSTKKFPKKSKVKERKTPEEKKEPKESENLKDIFLIRISSNYDSKTYDLAVQVDKNNLIQSIKVRNNKKNRTKTYGLERLKKEMTLVKTAGISLVTLECLNFSQDKGCKIIIEYPYNLTYGSFETFYAHIRKDGDQWRFFSGDRPFRRMKMFANKIFGLLVGVEKVELYE